jgi:hypothetical protein
MRGTGEVFFEMKSRAASPTPLSQKVEEADDQE